VLKKIIFSVLLIGTSIQSSQAFDIDAFRQLAEDTVRQLDMGVVGDIDAMIAMQEQLMIIGVEGGVSYVKSGGKDSTPLRLTLLNAETMKKMSLEKIEEQWHEGKFLASKGIDKDKIDYFGPVMNLMDTVIHPATSYIALRKYKKTGDASLLGRAKAELAEVLVHLEQYAQSQNGTQVNTNH